MLKGGECRLNIIADIIFVKKKKGGDRQNFKTGYPKH
jgi:hypothetical protein